MRRGTLYDERRFFHPLRLPRCRVGTGSKALFLNFPRRQPARTRVSRCAATPAARGGLCPRFLEAETSMADPGIDTWTVDDLIARPHGAREAALPDNRSTTVRRLVKSAERGQRAHPSGRSAGGIWPGHDEGKLKWPSGAAGKRPLFLR